MDLNSGEYKQKQDFDTIVYNNKIISLNDDLLTDLILEPSKDEPEDKELVKYKKRLWEDIKKVCGGTMTVDYLIMYQHIYLGESFRRICERFGVTHMAIFKRFKKVIQKLQFLYGVDYNKVPYNRREGSKL